MTRRSRSAWFLAIVVAAAACAPAAGASPAPADQAWRTTELVDVRTGDVFTIDGLRGSLVAIEPMAAWCSSCAIQQGEAQAALRHLGDVDLIYISVDVDPNEPAAELADYAERRGYDWRFVVAGLPVARSLAETFGDQILSPPSTPLILVGPDGEVVDLDFGIHSADALVELFSRHLP